MIGIILAAGDGKRLKNSSKEDYCKPLIKVNGKRLIEYSLDNLMKLDVKKAYIVVGKEGDLIQKSLGYSYNGIQIFYVVQSIQTGLMDAFVQAINIAGCEETVILQLSDEIFYDLKIDEIKKLAESGANNFYCGVTYEDDTEKIKKNFSVDTDNKGIIKKCIEKPLCVVNNIKGTGFCIFGSDALKVLTNINDTEINLLRDLCDYINYLLVKGKTGLALHIAEKEFNINTFADLLEAQDYLDINLK